MYKVVKFTPAKDVSVSTSKSIFDKVIVPGYPEADVKGGFVTRNDARNFITELYKSNPLTAWHYRVEKE